MRYGILALGLGLAVAVWTAEPAAAQNVARGLEGDEQTTATQVGTRGANFLRIGPSARARGLGDAGTAIATGAEALFYNPAVSATVTGFNAAASYSDLYGGSGITHSYGAAVLPVGQGAIGLHAVVLNSGDIQATTEIHPHGNDPVLGNFVEWTAVSAGLSYARRITDRLAVGSTLKFAQEGMNLARVQWFGFDLGTVFDTGVYGVRLSAAVMNIGGEARFEGEGVAAVIDERHRIFNDRILGSDLAVRHMTNKMQMPTMFRLGLRTSLLGTASSLLGGIAGPHQVDLVTEITDGYDTDLQPRFGAEYSFNEMFFLRGGKYFANEARSPWTFGDGLSAGAGVRVPFLGGQSLQVDYAYTTMGLLNNVQTFSIQIGS